MKFISELTALSPLLLFYFMVGLTLALGLVCLPIVASANSYYWTLFGLEGLYAVFTGFLVYRFLKA